IRDAWNKAFAGSSKAGKVAVLEEGMKYSPISISPEQAQFLSTRKFQVEEIARIFKVPPHLIASLDHATFSNIEHQSISFVQNSLEPWVSRWEQSMHRCLLREDEKGTYFFKMNMDGLMRGDYQSRMSGYATAIQNGFLSPNDIRAMEDWNLIPDEMGGNQYMVNGNMISLKQVMNNSKETENNEVLELEE
ncbi:MAG: phage portal protein, partial [Sphaerochaetaceae bacterium]|nr:phage portal protein [Sphaerochaetaceae bacterium]